ncbi:deoxyuridine 5'-triphosphate nucleotidohydrolase [Allostella sp. ATCC 35155]|nr:deoxyuridine 5'-triphosphate nucleotidohydrolase [Stella sp. ATCC 35155]
MRCEIRLLRPEMLARFGMPGYQSAMAAGIDLVACLERPLVLYPQAPAILVPTGIAIHMAEPSVAAMIYPRSGLAHRKGLVLGNGVAVIDADYQGEIMVSVWNRNPPSETETVTVHPGDRIAQMVFVPILRPEFAIVSGFSSASDRGTGGFGSTGVAAA